MNILDLTGSPYDGFCERLGLNPTILRYNLRVLKPHPVVAIRGVQQKADVPSEYNDGEMFQCWDSSIPKETLRDCLGVRWLDMIQPTWADQRWDLKTPSAPKFVKVRVFGLPIEDALCDLYKLTFVGMGEDDA